MATVYLPEFPAQHRDRPRRVKTVRFVCTTRLPRGLGHYILYLCSEISFSCFPFRNLKHFAAYVISESVGKRLKKIKP